MQTTFYRNLKGPIIDGPGITITDKSDKGYKNGVFSFFTLVPPVLNSW